MKTKAWIMLLFASIVGGCSDGWVDISNRPEIIDHGDGRYYGTGVTLVVRHPIQVSKYSERHCLVLLGWRNLNTNDVDKVLPQAQGVLATGTLVTVEEVFYKRHWENGDSIIPIGRILTGPYVGRKVDMEQVRQRYFLKRVDDTSTNDADVYTLGFTGGAGLKKGVPRP
jgi:hypothetical protein